MYPPRPATATGAPTHPPPLRFEVPLRGSDSRRRGAFALSPNPPPLLFHRPLRGRRWGSGAGRGSGRAASVDARPPRTHRRPFPTHRCAWSVRGAPYAGHGRTYARAGGTIVVCRRFCLFRRAPSRTSLPRRRPRRAISGRQQAHPLSLAGIQTPPFSPFLYPHSPAPLLLAHVE